MNSLDTYTSTPEAWPLTPPSGSRLRRSVIRRSLKNSGFYIPHKVGHSVLAPQTSPMGLEPFLIM